MSSSTPAATRTQTRAEVWGPHYWFFLHTVARTYPLIPNEVTKRKYYDFVMNLPLFIPDPEIAVQFSHLIDSFPVSPYLTNRDSFMRWMYFIHNKMNHRLEKYEPTFEEAVQEYDDRFRAPVLIQVEKFRLKKHHFFLAAVAVGIFIAYVGYRRGGGGG